MSQAVKAFLLSTFVFPGLGQLYKGDLKKGVICVLAATFAFSLLLLLGIFYLWTEYAPIYPAPPTPELRAQIILKVLHRPALLLIAAAIVGLWVFSALDAMRGGKAPHPEEA